MFNKSAFGQRFCACREKQNLSRAELAKLLGVTENYIFSLEAGRKTPSMPLFIEIINLFHLKADDLIRDSIDEPTEAVLIEVDEKVKKLSGKALKIANALLDTLIENID